MGEDSAAYAAGLRMTPITLWLPLPQTANHHYYYARGRVVLTEAARAFRREVWAIVMEQTTPSEREALPDRLHLHLVVTFGDRRRHDLDNCVKEIQDAVCEALGIDDSRIWELTCIRRGRRGDEPTRPGVAAMLMSPPSALLEANSRVVGLQQRIADLERWNERLREALRPIVEWHLIPSEEFGSRYPGRWETCYTLSATYQQMIREARAALAEQGEWEVDVPTVPPRIYPSDAPIVSRQKRPDLDLDALAEQGEGE